MASYLYRDKIRVRTNGLLVKDNAVLLVQLHSPVTDELIWTPPGGGLEFGETLEACLKREFREETGLDVEVHELTFINELVEPPFHAIEFYFIVSHSGGTLKLGIDPEQHVNEQFLQDVQWVKFDKINRINLAPPRLEDVLTGEQNGIQSSVLYTSFHRDF